MRKLNRKYLIWSLIICFFIPLFIPSVLYTDGMNSYLYGLPLEYITIYQRYPTSGWFFDNFFGGNHGMAINPGTFAINVIIVYLILRLVGFVRIRFWEKDN